LTSGAAEIHFLAFVLSEDILINRAAHNRANSLLASFGCCF
jgi:hypothetical protein